MKKRKLLSILLAVCISLSVFSFVGCGADDGEPIDETKTQLYVSNYDGGYGSQWLYDIANKFANDNAETSFQEGKMGVQFHFDSSKNNGGKTVLSNISSSRNEIYFTEGCYYYDFVSSHKLLDISDVVTSVNADSKTIESKLTKEQQSYYKTSNGSYYALPHYLGFTGIMYDIDLFESEKLYFNETGGFISSLSDTKSKGPDDLANTADDGLPATYTEFYKLCDRMGQKGITPFIWSGEYSFYTDWLLTALLCDYEGLDQMMLNYTFDGKATSVATVNEGVVSVEPELTITKENGYKLFSQAGRYYALDFMKNVISKGYVDSKSYSPNTSHTTAQNTFLKSSDKGEPIAFLVEGIWWANEADATFKRMGNEIDPMYSKSSRKLGYFPLPKATSDKVGEKLTIYDTNYACAFINANIDSDKIDAAKAFLQYCYTDSALQDFTVSTGTPKALKYDMGERLDELTPYAKNIWNTYSSADIVYPYANNNLYLSAQSSFVTYETWVTQNSNNAVEALRLGTSAEAFFKGIVSLNSSTRWEQKYSTYFD